MENVRNGSGKLVCRIDKSKMIVEIVIKGQTTIIRFFNDGTVTVTNN